MYIYSLNNHPRLEQEVIKKSGLRPGSFEERVFNNGEYYLRINEDVKGRKAVVLAVVTDPQGDIFKINFLLNALKSNKASKVILILTYYPYSRQDRVDKPGEPVSSELMAGQYVVSGADKIITFDIHNPRAIGHYRRYFKNIELYDLIADKVSPHIDSSWVAVAPDKGAVKRVGSIAKILKIKKTAHLKKMRPEPGKAKILEIIGAPIKDEKVLIIDDMIDTAGTLVKAAEFIRGLGAKQIIAAATHGIFSRDAIKRINLSGIKKVIITDSLPQEGRASGKLDIVDISGEIEKAIKKYV